MKHALQTAVERMTMNPGNGDICIGPTELGFQIDDKDRIIVEGDSDKPYPFLLADFYGEKWEIIPAKLKTHDEMKELFTETFNDAPFITPEIIEKMADLFLPLSEKPKWVEIDKVKEAGSQLEIERLRSAPESEKVLAAGDVLNKFKEEFGGNPGIWENGFMRGVNDGRDNWRLERDLELRSFIEKFNKIFDLWKVNEYRSVSYATINDTMIEFKNLKPLKAE